MNWNAKERSEIALNRIWTEHVEKEKLTMKPKTKYTCSAAGVRSFVTEKVGYSVGQEEVHIEDEDVKLVVQALLEAQKTPVEKLAAPVTSSHEVGWYSQPLVAPNPRFVFGLKQAEATSFAETYTKKMAGEHMFHGKSGKYLKF